MDKPQKLDIQHKHIIRLIARGRDETGWAKVSEMLYPVLSENMPADLVEFRKEDVGGFARLTPTGQSVLDAMAYL